jgi:ABC-2 type transport system ATP-binding protein
MIEVNHLTKRYRSTRAVDDLSFQVDPGHVTGFLGPNGAGKSTTMRLILGLDTPDGGTAMVAGRPYRSIRRPAHTVGAVLDATAVHPGRSAFQHLHCLAAANGIDTTRVRRVLEQVGLGQACHRRAGGLSLGMKQRLGIAAALLGDPPVLMFDEPVNGLDPEGVRWIRTLFKTMAAQGRTVFVSSHLISEMAVTADHLIIIGAGRLIAHTTVADLTHTNPPVQVMSAQAGQLAAVLARHGAEIHDLRSDSVTIRGMQPITIGNLAAHHQLPIHHLAAQPDTLEDAYLRLTDSSVQYRTATLPTTDGVRP